MDNKSKKERLKTILIVLLAFLSITSSTILANAISNRTTAVIELDDEQELTHNNGLIRITLNGSVSVKDGIMQDINFANYNAERIIKFMIKNGDNLLYESNYINPGEIVIGDFVSTDGLEMGSNDVIVEVRYYSLSKMYIGQTNVKVDLNYLG